MDSLNNLDTLQILDYMDTLDMHYIENPGDYSWIYSIF